MKLDTVYNDSVQEDVAPSNSLGKIQSLLASPVPAQPFEPRTVSESLSGSVANQIAAKESGGKYTATNPNSSATGKYQFLWSEWGKDIKNYTGLDRDQFLNNPEAQEKYYSHYEKNYLFPAANRVAKHNTKNLSTDQLAKLVHFRGEKGAKDWLTGKASDKPESFNMPTSKYLGYVPKYAMGGLINDPGKATVDGANFVRNWTMNQPMLGMQATAISKKLKVPTLLDAATFDKRFGFANRGVYSFGEGNAYVKPLATDAATRSTSAHETTHQLQDILENNPAWNKSYDLIQNSVKYDGSTVQEPIEIHSRIMQAREDMQSVPGVPFDIEGFEKKYPKEKPLYFRQLEENVKGGREGLLNLMNSVVSNKSRRNVPVGAMGGYTPKYVQGGWLESNSGTLSTLASGLGGVMEAGGAGQSYGGSAISGALQGAGAGLALGPVGAIVGGTIGLVSGLVQKGQRDKQKKMETEMQRNQTMKSLSQLSQQNMNMFKNQPKFGFFRYGGYIPKYAAGGDVVENPEYEVEKDEVVRGLDTQLEQSKQLSTDLHHVTGGTHEEGGVLGSGGEMVYSNRIKITDDTIAFMKMNGITVDKNETPANVAKKLGEIKGKHEAKMTTHDPIARKTAELMITRIDGLLDVLFAEQERDKEEMPQFRMGGYLPKYVGGGKTPIKQRKPAGFQQADLLKKYGPQMDAKVKNTQIAKSGSGFDLSTTVPYLLSGIGHLATSNAINNMKTTYTPGYVAAPTYNYTNRVGDQIADVNQTIRGTLGSVPEHLRGSIVAQGLEAKNRIYGAENQRQDQYNDQYSNRNLQVNAINAQYGNQAAMIGLQLGNAQNEARADNVSNTLGNINTIIGEKNQRELDTIRAAIGFETAAAGRTTDLGKESLDRLRKYYKYMNPKSRMPAYLNG